MVSVSQVCFAFVVAAVALVNSSPVPEPSFFKGPSHVHHVIHVPSYHHTVYKEHKVHVPVYIKEKVYVHHHDYEDHHSYGHHYEPSYSSHGSGWEWDK
ncbi:histidine-rich glycoprotein [Diaphorina citri]|uniref:Histidine-rich glycoprotein n=1 Tax=Diaphorina citri TaxID=121845 RepID=A0A1S3DGT8_DIACI|nr:histidine-rich glycoprotein [Diaphorina citri]KAI5701579.1 hypothetical protein M8J75_011042 [Diaphorina citri]KAI5729437.1 hypothetical protein M8J76_002560 [Diaphorina citri]KAI5735694.1 hypothetical protein M8J77_021406 [Diaphorina citri]